jgi:predicted RNA binding protein with dsRBD fold (UPF0201 family)
MAKQEQITATPSQVEQLKNLFTAWREQKTTENAQKVEKVIDSIFKNDKFKWNRLFHMDFVTDRSELREFLDSLKPTEVKKQKQLVLN